MVVPTVCNCSIDDKIENDVQESPLSPDQREILRFLLENFQDPFATCLEDVGTENYKPFQIELKPGSQNDTEQAL